MKQIKLKILLLLCLSIGIQDSNCKESCDFFHHGRSFIVFEEKNDSFSSYQLILQCVQYTPYFKNIYSTSKSLFNGTESYRIQQLIQTFIEDELKGPFSQPTIRIYYYMNQNARGQQDEDKLRIFVEKLKIPNQLVQFQINFRTINTNDMIKYNWMALNYNEINSPQPHSNYQKQFIVTYITDTQLIIAFSSTFLQHERCQSYNDLELKYFDFGRTQLMDRMSTNEACNSKNYEQAFEDCQKLLKQIVSENVNKLRFFQLYNTFEFNLSIIIQGTVQYEYDFSFEFISLLVKEIIDQVDVQKYNMTVMQAGYLLHDIYSCGY